MSTVGRAPPSADGSGNQWIRTVVPSNDVRSKSDATPGTGTALVDSQPLGGWQSTAAPAADPRGQWIGDSSEIAVDPAAKAMATTRATAATISAAERQGDLGATRNVDALVPIVPVTTRRLPVLRPVPDRRSRTTAPTTPSASTVGRRILHWPDNDRRSLPSGALEDRALDPHGPPVPYPRETPGPDPSVENRE